MPQLLVFLLIGLPVLIVATLALSFVPEWQTWRLSKLGLAVGLGVPADLEAALRSRFRLRGVAGAIGGLIGFGAAIGGLAILARASTLPLFGGSDSATLLAGYAVIASSSIGLAWGSAWASLRSVTARDGETRVARLTVPGLGDYVPPVLRFGAWALVALAIATVVIVWMGETPAARRLQTPSIALVAVGAVGVVVFEALSHRVLARGRPAADTDELVWDDALRSEALRYLLIAPFQALALGTIYSFAVPGLSGISAFALFPALLGLACSFAFSGYFRVTRTWYLHRLWPGARRRTPDEEARRITAASRITEARAR